MRKSRSPTGGASSSRSIPRASRIVVFTFGNADAFYTIPFACTLRDEEDDDDSGDDDDRYIARDDERLA